MNTNVIYVTEKNMNMIKQFLQIHIEKASNNFYKSVEKKLSDCISNSSKTFSANINEFIISVIEAERIFIIEKKEHFLFKTRSGIIQTVPCIIKLETTYVEGSIMGIDPQTRYLYYYENTNPNNIMHIKYDKCIIKNYSHKYGGGDDNHESLIKSINNCDNSSENPPDYCE
jgi:hypothetical protein